MLSRDQARERAFLGHGTTHDLTSALGSVRGKISRRGIAKIAIAGVLVGLVGYIGFYVGAKGQQRAQYADETAAAAADTLDLITDEAERLLDENNRLRSLIAEHGIQIPGE